LSRSAARNAVTAMQDNQQRRGDYHSVGGKGRYQRYWLLGAPSGEGCENGIT